eukprot:7877329-Pyramimonas_sp.AAC.1
MGHAPTLPVEQRSRLLRAEPTIAARAKAMLARSRQRPARVTHCASQGPLMLETPRRGEGRRGGGSKDRFEGVPEQRVPR